MGAWVELEDRLGVRHLLARRLQQPLQIEGHILRIRHQAGGRIGEAVGNAHILDALAQALLDLVDQFLEFLAEPC